MAASYPGSVPTIAHNKTNNTSQFTDHPNHHRQLAEELNAVMTELGVTPSGDHASVAAALEYLKGLAHSHPVEGDAASLSLSDFGSPADGSAALEAAFDELATLGGGELLITPGAPWVIDEPVVVNFTDEVSHLRIKGYGSSSQLLPATGSGENAISFAGTGLHEGLLTIQGITGVGDPDEDADCSSLFLFSDGQINIRDCAFYGIGTNGAANLHGLLRAVGANMHIRDSIFRGCADNGAASGIGLIYSEDYEELIVDGCRFVDYGTLNGVYHSKTPTYTNNSWVGAGTPSFVDGYVHVSDCFFDEGTSWAVAATANSGISDLSRLTVERCKVNYGLSGGIIASEVHQVRIEDFHISYFDDTPQAGTRDIAYLSNVDRAVLDGARGRNFTSNITALNMDVLEVHDNCLYDGIVDTSVASIREPSYDAIP